MSWTLYALAGAVVASVASLALKRALAYGPLHRTVMTHRISAGALLLSAALLMRPGMPPAPVWGLLAVVLPLEILGNLMSARALRDGDLSLVSPMSALTPLFLLITAPLLIGEQVGTAGVLAVMISACGVYLLESTASRTPLEVLAAIVRHPSSRAMVLSCLCYSLTTTLAKPAAQEAGATLWAGMVSFGSGLCLLGLPSAAPAPDHIRPSRPWVRWTILATLASALSAFLIMSAITEGSPVFVSAIKRVSAVFGLPLGVLVLGEPWRRERLMGALVLVGGTLLILRIA